MRVALVGVLLLCAACSGGSDEPTDEITRIDGPAVVDPDQGGANQDGDEGGGDAGGG
ncbi:MAG: hypothetical protein ABJH68_03890 [Ilumatobacter sp.]|uniref:hypothetical protein n=1 Tax=Ilumatobacter sp. TaxID=1967498 RepID=UPI003298FE2D